jgi:hypothetical protein
MRLRFHFLSGEGHKLIVSDRCCEIYTESNDALQSLAALMPHSSDFLSAAMCVGVVLQHPPTRIPFQVPLSRTFRMISAISSCQSLRAELSLFSDRSFATHFWVTVS